MNNKPLSGIKILDLTRLLPGPLATQMMGDMGADVIKIEDSNSPDYTRYFPPHQKGHSLYFLSINRSKRSLCINLRSDEGKALFLDMVKSADVVIESYRPGIMQKIGIDYERAKAINPKIIYVSLTGYGQDGPYSQLAGHDLNYIGFSGILGLTGTKEKPVMPGTQIADIAGGSYPAVIATLAAILSRNTTGEGQQVDVAMAESILPMMSFTLAEYMNTGKSLDREEPMLSGGIANYNIYECKDGLFVAMGALEPKFWKGFCAMVNQPDWVKRMMPSPKLVEPLKVDLQTLFLTKTRDEWCEQAAQHDICLTPIYNLDEVDKDVHYQSRQLFVETESEHYGKFKGVNQPIQFNNQPNYSDQAAPILGEHTQEILKEFGYSSADIDSMVEKGFVKTS